MTARIHRRPVTAPAAKPVVPPDRTTKWSPPKFLSDQTNIQLRTVDALHGQEFATEQERQRVRRRRRLEVVYGADFDLGVELTEILEPLAERVASDPRPGLYLEYVGELVAATHAVLLDIDGLVAESDAPRRTSHLDADSRQRAVRLLLDRARQHPAPAQADAAELSSGRWHESLVQRAVATSAPLADLLARVDTVSAHLEGALRQLDTAALNLGGKLDRVAADRATFAARRPVTPTAKSVEDELRALGVTGPWAQ